jgi:hypothetical protein
LRRCPFAQGSEVPVQRSAHRPLPWSLWQTRTNARPHRRRSRWQAGAGGLPNPALAGNLEKRTPGRRACQCRGVTLPWREAMARFERHGSERAGHPDVALGPTADPQGSCGTRPGGDRSWRCSTAQLRVRPGGSGCATQGYARGPSSALRTVLTATDPWAQPNAAPPLTPSLERVPRIAHAAVGCAILVQGYCSRSTGRHAREPPLVRAVVVVSLDGSTQV